METKEMAVKIAEVVTKRFFQEMKDEATAIREELGSAIAIAENAEQMLEGDNMVANIEDEASRLIRDIIEDKLDEFINEKEDKKEDKVVDWSKYGEVMSLDKIGRQYNKGTLLVAMPLNQPPSESIPRLYLVDSVIKEDTNCIRRVHNMHPVYAEENMQFVIFDSIHLKGLSHILLHRLDWIN